MTTAVQHRRGTTAEHSTFTGLEGEVTIDTTKDTAVIHDGILAGGYPLAKETLANVNPSTLGAITGSATASDDLFLVFDTSTLTMKKITRAELNNAMEVDALANVTITGGTINGTTIGATTAAAGTFTTLTATGTVTIPDNAISGDKVEGGTINAITINTLSANPTLSAGTANGVTYLNGSKVLTSGSALTFNGTHLGVGSSDYGNAGTINASIGVAGTTAGGLQLWASSAQEHFIQWGDSTTGSATYAGAISYSHASDFMRFWVNSSEAMRLTSTGLGIGTTSPGSNKLHVVASASPGVNGLSIKAAGAGGTYPFRVTWASGTEGDMLAVNDSGNVGIGTSSPAQKLHVVGKVLATDNLEFSGADTAIVFQSGAGRFFTGGTERARIDSSGNLLVGATAPALTEKFYVSTSTTEAARITNQVNSSGYSGLRVVVGASDTSTWHFRGETRGFSNWYLFGNGTTSYSSDERLKKNIETTRDGYLNDLMQLRVVKYNWEKHEDGTPKELGLIAQEVEKVFPGLIHESDIEGVDGLRKNIKQSVLPFIMLKAIQELKSELDTVKAELATLKGN